MFDSDLVYGGTHAALSRGVPGRDDGGAAGPENRGAAV